MEQKKLNEIIKSHEEWVNSGGKKGSRADLSGADLRRADLCGAILCGAILHGVTLPKGIYVAGGAGSQQRNTYYDAINDHVICGCWNDKAGNHLDNFKKRIEDIY